MRLEIIKDLRLARPEPWLPQCVFKIGEVVDTDDEYVIDYLLQLKCAKKTKKSVVEKEEKEVESTKLQEVTKDKSQDVPKDKSFLDSTIDIKDLDIDVA